MSITATSRISKNLRFTAGQEELFITIYNSRVTYLCDAENRGRTLLGALTIYSLSGWLGTHYSDSMLFSHNAGHIWYTLLGMSGDLHQNPIHELSNWLIRRCKIIFCICKGLIREAYIVVVSDLTRSGAVVLPIVQKLKLEYRDRFFEIAKRHIMIFGIG